VEVQIHSLVTSAIDEHGQSALCLKANGSIGQDALVGSNFQVETAKKVKVVAFAVCRTPVSPAGRRVFTILAGLSSESNIGLRRITKLRSTTDLINDGGPIRL
jgi:hypothetical protein